jgi:hypothetical protein
MMWLHDFRSRSILLVAGVLLWVGAMHVREAGAEMVRGDINGWQDSGGPVWMAQGVAFSGDLFYSVTHTSSATRASSGFKFDRSHDWAEQWGTGPDYVNAAVNSTVGQARKNEGGNDPVSLTFAETNGRRYTFRLGGAGDWWDRPYVIMETSADPVAITSVSDDHAVSGTDPVTVAIGLTASKSAEENIWVRYSLDSDFVTSTLIPASGSGTNYTATIPGQLSGTMVYYYALSSTMPSNVITSNFDLCTLRGNNNAGANYTYEVDDLEPDLGNAWHHPGNAEPEGAFMRNPVQPFADEAVFFYNGNQFQGGPEAGDQNGGTLYFREVGGGAWQSAGLSFDVEKVNNKYWVAEIPADTFTGGDAVEYYFEITYTDRDTTYLGTTNNVSSEVFAQAAEAQAAPFAFTYGANPGEGAGYLWHAENVVPLGDAAAQFWVKIGYADGNGSNRWVDNVVLYYTTNNTAPVITGNGVAGAGTFMQALTFSHMEEDVSESGDAMWWSGVVEGIPDDPGGLMRYRIGAWNSAFGHGQRFADYQTAAGETEFSYSLYVPGASELQVSIDGGISWVNANYTTSKAFIDEIAGDELEVRVRYLPGAAGIKNVELFSNIDRRDYVNVDYTNQWIAGNGYPDGILPPDGNLLTTNDVGAYFRPFPMPYNAGSGFYEWSTNVTRCGAYRLTARYQGADQSGTNWTWYSSEGRRDHALVLSPTKVHQLTMYEVNPLTIKATDNTKAGRSTFADLLTGGDSFNEFNLNYLNRLQVNTLWFQPIHPSAVTTRGDPGGYEPGSPYATRDYFAVSKWFGRDETEAGAMQEFADFVAACDTNAADVGTINIMLDGVFNHTAWDAILGQGGVDLGFTADPQASMPGTRPGWYSYWQDYGQPATFYNDVFDNDIAVAPDRGDFGKWLDTADLFFGRYSALVRHNPDNNSDYLNEGDVYDFAGMTPDTKDLWLYFGHYVTFWLEQTGHSLTNAWIQENDDLGIDGLRCDFGQGLPPQFWEYFINHTRSMKWNFVFMAETLDGGVPGYRSNRHFDVLNEDILFTFHNEIDANTIRNAVEQRRNAYSGGSILLNQTSHDETMPSEDPWQTASYYGAAATVDGIPMLFNGQEWGIRPAAGEWAGVNTDWGFTHFELNFGKWIPHFKQWNKATFWESPPSLSDGLAQWHGRVNWARLNSPALQSRNRWFLNNADGFAHSRIMSVAKYETPYAGPVDSDVVLAFALVLGSPHEAADFTYDLQPVWDVMGMSTGKYYNVRNLASSDATALIWPEPQSGQTLYEDGLWVSFTAGIGEGNAITDDGALVQYLKVVEVDAPVQATQDSPVPVPYSWIDGYFPGSHTSQEYEDLVMNMAANGTMTVWESFVANIDPTDPGAIFNVSETVLGGGNTERHITFMAQPDRIYRIRFTDSLTEEPVAWALFADTEAGSFSHGGEVPMSHTFVDDEGPTTTGAAPVTGIRYYRLEVMSSEP